MAITSLDRLTPEQQFDLLLESIDHLGTRTRFRDDIEDEFGVRVSEDVAKVLTVLNMKVAVATAGDNVEKVTRDSDGEYVYDVYRKAADADADVYMGVSLNQKKARIVFDRNPENRVVRLPAASWYDQFDVLGWKQLRDVDLRAADTYDDVSEQVASDILTDMNMEHLLYEGVDKEDTASRGTPPARETLNVAMGTALKKQQKFVAEDIRATFEQGEPVTIESKDRSSWGKTKTNTYHVDTLLLSPSNTERNMSNYYWLGGSAYEHCTVALANCNVGTYEYLEDLPQVHHLDDFIERSWNISLPSSHGDVTVEDAGDRLVVHVVPDTDIKDRLLDVASDVPEVLDHLVNNPDDITYLSERTWDAPDISEIIYTVIARDELVELLPAINDSGALVLYAGKKPRSVNVHQRYSMKNLTWLYAATVLNDWDISTPVLKGLYTSSPGVTNGGCELVDMLAHRHNDGRPPVDYST